MSSQVTEFPLESSRYILAQIGQNNIAFPEDIVVEIASLEQHAVLRLPFYDSRLLGVAHYRGKLIPLCTLTHQDVAPTNVRKETLTAIRLNDLAGVRAGIGIVVNKILGQVKASQLTVGSESITHIFSYDDLPDTIWQLQRSSAGTTTPRIESSESSFEKHSPESVPNDSTPSDCSSSSLFSSS